MSSKKKKSLASDFTKFLIGESEDSSSELKADQLETLNLSEAELNPESIESDNDSQVTIESKLKRDEKTALGRAVQNSGESMNEDRTLLKGEALKEQTDKDLVPEVSIDHRSVQQESELEQLEEKLKTDAGAVVLSANASLLQAERLRLVSEKNRSLELECDQLRGENDRLSVEVEGLRKRVESLVADSEGREKRMEDHLERTREEKLHLTETLRSKENQIQELCAEVEELKNQLTADLKKIRVRERELENRLEMIKLEKSAVMQTKDQTILDLKRRIDQLISDIDNYKDKGKRLSEKLTSHEERIHRSVRALRLALSNLEDDDNLIKIKKAE